MPDEKPKWYHHPVVVLLLIFVLGLGPFGLPLLYKSPSFYKTWKIVITFLTIIFTIYIVWGTYYIVQKILGSIQTAMGSAVI